MDRNLIKSISQKLCGARSADQSAQFNSTRVGASPMLWPVVASETFKLRPIMWSPSTLATLIHLADRQDYPALWRLVLGWCFPLQTQFAIVDDMSIPQYARASTVNILHRPSSSVVLIVSWSPPSKSRALDDDLYIYGHSSKSYSSRRIMHLHARGTQLVAYDLLRTSRKASVSHYVPALPEQSHMLMAQDFSQLIDGCDLLRNTGFERLLLQVCRASVRVRCAFDARRVLSRDLVLDTRRILDTADTKPPVISWDSAAAATSPGTSPPYNLRASERQEIGINDLPIEVFELILERLDLPSLRMFALSNSRCCQLVERRLWYTYRIRASEESQNCILDSLRALLRLGRRARLVRRLILGPCTWTWDDDALTMLPAIWQATSNIKQLFLEVPDYLERGRWQGGELSPVMRSLTRDGTHIRLEVFKYEGWLLNQSCLFDFLSTQPHITCMVGVDVCDPDLFAPPPTFLPALRSLMCSGIDTPRMLAAGRPITSLEIRDTLSVPELVSLLTTLSAYSIPLQNFRFRLTDRIEPNTPPIHTSPRDFLTEIVGYIPNIRRLAIDPLHVEKEDLEVLKLLPVLKVLELGGMPDWGVGSDLSAWDAVVGPSLQRIIFPLHRLVLVKPPSSGSDPSPPWPAKAITSEPCPSWNAYWVREWEGGRVRTHEMNVS